jgi:ribosomal protein S18 acetylase RimI-like enzyme
MPVLTIRDIQDDDIEPVVELWRASGVARPWNDPYRDLGFARREPNSTVLVGEAEGGLVASVMVGQDGHRGWAYYLAVAPRLQGQGLGRAMMQAAEDWLQARGVWKAQLMVREDNAGVRAFYERLGYRDTRTVCLQKVLETPDQRTAK